MLGSHGNRQTPHYLHSLNVTWMSFSVLFMWVTVLACLTSEILRFVHVYVTFAPSKYRALGAMEGSAFGTLVHGIHGVPGWDFWGSYLCCAHNWGWHKGASRELPSFASLFTFCLRAHCMVFYSRIYSRHRGVRGWRVWLALFCSDLVPSGPSSLLVLSSL